MTYRLTLGVDPGQTGAIAVLADHQFVRFIDMPLMDRPVGGGQMIDDEKLAAILRGVRGEHRGAYAYAVIERVQAIGKSPGAHMFRFGQSDGIVRGVLGALGFPKINVEPQEWKKFLQIAGKKVDPDAGRQAALRLYPEAAEFLARKKDSGRADALLIARWALLTEQVASAA